MLIPREFEKLPNTKIFWTLVIVFGIFYLVQIPFMTSNSDVIIYSLRSKSHTPIIDYAFLESSVCSDGTPLPNYHIAHTLILWLAYQPMPEFLKNSIWPAGLVSAISATFSVGIVFLIWCQLGISKSKSILASVVYGIVPTVWHHAVIGEVYSLQFLFVYLFLYQFLKGRILLSALSFTLANLVSPLSGLSFSLILIGEKSKKQFSNAILIGLLAIAFYFSIVSVLKIDIFRAFTAVGTDQRSFSWKIYKFLLILILNLNIFLLFIYQGLMSFKSNTLFHLSVLASICPYVFLAFYDSQFLTENGSFLLIAFWACAYFIADGIMRTRMDKYLLVGLFIHMVVYFAFWNMHNREVAVARKDAAFELKEFGLSEMKIVGSWSHSAGILIDRDGWDMTNLSEKLINIAVPSEESLLQTQEDSLLLVYFNRDHLIARLSKAVFPAARLNTYDPKSAIRCGTLVEKCRNRFFVIYLWGKSEKENLD